MTIDKIVNGVVFKTKQITDQEREVRKRKLATVMHAAGEEQKAIGKKYNDLELEETGGWIEPN